MQKIFDVEIDLDLLEQAELGRGGFGAVRARRAPLPMCDVEVVGTYPHREDELDGRGWMHRVVERDRDRRKGKRCEEGSPDHRRGPYRRRADGLAACRHCLKTAFLSSLARGDAWGTQSGRGRSR
ncbi:MAG TPA: hypothetical protein VFT33_07435, partial [Gaiellaceae bacterium]|nr:hypothetical protein [Gaiellaceae bacterium]